MPLRDIPPAGNTIALSPAGAPPAQWPPGYRALLVNSGTAALGLALLAARLRHPHIAAPEAILPGYGCPDLVAAARFAGVRAVVADIGAGDPAYDAGSLRRVLNENTVAVVAVNFLGIAECLAELRASLQDWPRVALVEDDAQWFPEPFPNAALHGDAVCLSFGRGKPVSLLGGGVLLLRESWLRESWLRQSSLCEESLRESMSADAIPEALAGAIGEAQPASLFAAKVRLYNLLSHPRLYAAINRNPLLRLGQTVFKPLAAATALPDTRAALLQANIERYLALPQNAAAWLHAGLPRARDLPAQLAPRGARLLRYPVLCRDRAERDELLARLRAAGLGATALYQRIMPEVEGVGDQVDVRVPLAGARAFADRLLTLPVHAGVRERDAARMLDLIR